VPPMASASMSGVGALITSIRSMKSAGSWSIANSRPSP